MAGDVGTSSRDPRRNIIQSVGKRDIIHPTCDFSITADAVDFRSMFQNNPNPGASKLELSVEKM